MKFNTQVEKYNYPNIKFKNLHFLIIVVTSSNSVLREIFICVKYQSF